MSKLWRDSLLSSTCTPEDLYDILIKPTNGYYIRPSEPYNEVFPQIYISDGTTALCTSLLRRIGITHVVNASCGKDRSFALVNTSPQFYRSSGIEFLGIEALDITIFPLYKYFDKAANFIHQCLTTNGKVLVHCGEGISRSATIVLAYMMIKCNFSAQEAVCHVRAHRSILPNLGFLKQLCELNDKLAYNRRRAQRTDGQIRAVTHKDIAVN